MALLMGQCHSVLLSGKLLNENSLRLKLPFDDIKSNLWQITLNEISVHILAELNVLIGISSNFVSDICYNRNNQIVNSNPILWQCPIKGNRFFKTTFRLDKSWFYINNVHDELELKFNVLENGEVSKKFVALNCELYVTVLLQRVK